MPRPRIETAGVLLYLPRKNMTTPEGWVFYVYTEVDSKSRQQNTVTVRGALTSRCCGMSSSNTHIMCRLGFSSASFFFPKRKKDRNLRCHYCVLSPVRCPFLRPSKGGLVEGSPACYLPLVSSFCITLYLRPPDLALYVSTWTTAAVSGIYHCSYFCLRLRAVDLDHK